MKYLFLVVTLALALSVSAQDTLDKTAGELLSRGASTMIAGTVFTLAPTFINVLQFQEIINMETSTHFYFKTLFYSLGGVLMIAGLTDIVNGSKKLNKSGTTQLEMRVGIASSSMRLRF